MVRFAKRSLNLLSLISGGRFEFAPPLVAIVPQFCGGCGATDEKPDHLGTARHTPTDFLVVAAIAAIANRFFIAKFAKIRLPWHMLFREATRGRAYGFWICVS